MKCPPYRTWLQVAATYLVAASAWGQPEPPAFLQPYPLSTEVEVQRDVADDHLLALGPIRRSGGLWRPAQSERLSGGRVRVTYRLPDGRPPDVAHQHWLQVLEPFTRQPLYRCRGRACGSSHHWANDVFGKHELYGPDQHQHYDVLALEYEGRIWAVAIYTIERGNRRVFTQVDAVVPDEAVGTELRISSDGLLSHLHEGGRAILEVLDTRGAAPSPQQVETLVQTLRRDVRMRLRVVGHARGEGTEEELESRARAYAEAVLEQLQAQGIAQRRLEAGTRISPGSDQRDRIELEIP